MAWGKLLWAVYLRCEDLIVAQILRSPTFHHGVQRIYRAVQELKYGRNPTEPLRPGEATAEPGRAGSFLKHFVEELKNQARGKPTDPPPPPPR
ncbi:hypothetical protein VTJ04DRAFT_10774 [Mycothermus thermophilus]|uniref:uncharacterized protein n=1 Tax=Humicola insolens TaxID=85995 RepID=UPI00374483A0